ncbi:hypothetical protein BCD67_24420 [Oscillatoriales cyanobacterium USR001]|nr:hypothetical protein BCD67_24420 [Oscillatoriales cyanobacterium USR001]
MALSGYQVLGQIYDSINSEVYRAIRESDREKVILKFLKQNYPTPSEITRYKQEYELTHTLNFEGVVKVYGLEKYQNTLVMFVEDFGGESLKKLRENHQFSLAEFLSIAIKVATSLGEIHSANIIHKDINPSNLVYHPETQQLKIIDFGISTRLTREKPTLKNPNILEGTLAYISPEQTGRMNRSLDYRTDFYSLGATFYEILTGKLPFETDDELELVHCHIAKQPLLPSEITPLVPLPVANIVMKLMAKNAEDRYQSAWGLTADLKNCLSQLESTGNITNFPLGSQDISDRFQISQKLYGRESEIETLITAFVRVASPEESEESNLNADDRSAELMLIAGYSGIGKSALVQEIYKPITEKRGYFIAGKFDQFQRNIPYSAIVNAFQQLVKQILTENFVQLQAWSQKFLAALGANGQIIIDVIPEIELIIGKQPPVPELGPTESQYRFNLVFQHFLRACCTKNHPLVIFLDDLQWADGATLKLIELMMTDPNLQYLFLIGAYRDNEVSSGHPLMIMLDDLRKNQVIIHQITLANLGLEDISKLVADTLKTDLYRVKPLAKLVLNKTGGNPFFINQFMKLLYTDNFIKFSYEEQKWQWDQAQIEAQNITDNVVELMIGKLRKLPSSTQSILQLAACIGANFDLHTLSIIGRKAPPEVFPDLVIAIESGLVLPLSELDGNLLIQNYKFLHDRVQQAAYSLINEDQKQATHLQIGQLLQQNSSEIEREEKLFDIVGHLNLGQELITQPPEREALAQLNLKAGIKARNATAYAGAMLYLQTGIELLTANCWQNQYELTLNLYIVAAESAYLNADLEGMEQMAAQVLQRGRTALDKVKIYEIKIAAQTAKGNPLAAIALVRESLEQLGVYLPMEPNETMINQGLETLTTQLQDRQIAQLVDLPVMTDIQTQSTMQLLSMLIAASVQGMPSLLPLVSCKMVSLSLEFGNTSASCVGYVLYGMVLCTVMGDLERSYEFGKLALNVLERFNAMEFKSIIMLFFGCFIQHRQEPLRAIMQTLKDGYNAGGETGEALYAGYSIEHYSYASFFSGIELSGLGAELAAYSDALLKLKQYSARNYLDLLRQAVHNFREFVDQPDCLQGSAYDETVMLPMHYQGNDLCAIIYVYIYKMLLAYSWENYTAALEYVIQIEQYIYSMSLGSVFIPILHFYGSLTKLAFFSESTELEKANIIAQVETHQTALHRWMQNYPINHQHKWHLIEAEKYRVLGNKAEAIEHYDRAIFLAKENQFLQEEALANELAAKFYLAWGKEKMAQNYMQEAHYAYTCWGAIAKVKYLEKKYPKLLTLTSITTQIKGNTTTRTSSGIDTSANLDLATVIKASQAISGEILLDKLLVSLMRIIIENAGAQTGYLLLKKSDTLTIEAIGKVEGDKITLSLIPDLPLAEVLPMTIINYVERTKKSAVLNNATTEAMFATDPYIIAHQTKSILCTPIINQRHFRGIVYLENNLVEKAFTSERLEVLKLLSSQASISLENALLYQTLEQKVQERTAQLAEANTEITALNEILKNENLRLNAELEVTRRLQKMMLPKEIELTQIPGLEIAGFMDPADEIGGDYYDVLSCEGRVKIGIGDVTGHGLESGMIMLMVQTAIRTLLEGDFTDPTKFLDVLNRTIYNNVQRMNVDKSMTLTLLDYSDGLLKLSGQHEDMIIVRSSGEVEKIDTEFLGFPIALVKEIADFVAATEVQLYPGDVGVLYTDGITEAINMNKMQYGLERLIEIVRKNYQRSAAEIKQAVIDNLMLYIGEQKVYDDITLLVFKQK